MDMEAVCLPKGTILNNRYELSSVIGTGGFGITYQAVDRLLNCYVAVKEFFPQEWVTRNINESYEVIFPVEKERHNSLKESLRNFRHEANILEAIKDVPYIARIRDHFEENATEYITLNLIQGQSLSEYAKNQGGTLPASEVLSLFQNLFDTLAQLHGTGIIHRDISPGNLMLSKDHLLYLIDFGSATSFNGRKELQNKQVFQHIGLEAPEHSQPDRQGPWTDIFSLCATMVYLITGEGIAEAKDRLHFDHLPQLLTRTALSSRQQNALMKGLNPEITHRFTEIEQLHTELYGDALTEQAPPKERPVFYHARTCTGSRPLNQDNFMVDTAFCYKGEDCEQSGIIHCRSEKIYVAAVCDGVGGSNYGELASKTAIQAIIHFAEARPGGTALPERLLDELLDQINEKILQLGEKIGQTATTLSLLLWCGNQYYTANIGDSPVFLLRNRKLNRLSTSHTKAAQNIMLQKPVQRNDWNTLLQFLGKKDTAGSQMAAFSRGKLQEGDIFLLCSDGVSKKIEDSRLKSFLAKKKEKSISAIFKTLTKSKHSDNCTAIVLKF